MKAAVYHGIRDIRVEDVPRPKADAGEVVVRVLRCAICGTDKRIYTHGQKNVVPPTVTGHEIVGIVEELGAGVKNVRIGAKVVVATVVGCGKCVYCSREQYNLCETFTALGYDYQGGFAEYMKIPARAVAQGNVIEVSKDLDPDHAALIEPLSCVLNGQEYLNAQRGDRAVVFGCGPIGLMHAGTLKAKGCDPVIVADVAAERLQYVEAFGVGTPLLTGSSPVEEILKAGGGEKFDIVVTAAWVKALQGYALLLVRKKARVSFFAGIPKDDPILPIDTNHLHYNEISVFGAFASNLRHYKQAAELVGSGKFPAGKFVTHRFKLADIQKGFDAIEAGHGIKIVVDCT